jgi:hypothetical protein
VTPVHVVRQHLPLQEFSRQRIQTCGISDLPPEKALGIRTLPVNNDPLAAIIHAKGAAGSGPVYQLQPDLARREFGPLIDVLRANAEIAERLNCHERCSRSVLHFQLTISRARDLKSHPTATGREPQQSHFWYWPSSAGTAISHRQSAASLRAASAASAAMIVLQRSFVLCTQVEIKETALVGGLAGIQIY